MEKSNYKSLIVWQKAMDLTAVVYKLAKKIAKGRIVFFKRPNAEGGSFNTEQYCGRTG